MTLTRRGEGLRGYSGFLALLYAFMDQPATEVGWRGGGMAERSSGVERRRFSPSRETPVASCKRLRPGVRLLGQPIMNDDSMVRR